jgi:long-chain acyl-CoA synthetase
VLTAGPHVMRGYYRRPEMTAEVFDGEWLRTGDLGELDADGFLRITGRLKNLIVLPGGRKVQPEEVEAVLARSALVGEVCVAGTASRGGLSDGDEEVCAVVVPAGPLADRFAGRAEALAEEIRQDLGRIGAVLSPYKRPTRLVVRAERLPMTSTRKIRRPLVRSWLETQEAPAR